MRIAVDAMGGDHAPGEVVAGAVRAAESAEVDSVLLVGDKDAISACLPAEPPAKIRIVHASQVVEMTDSPAQAVRRKRDSSIVRCLDFVREGEADAMISAGNTGALVVGATIYLKLIKGIKRPGIAVQLPTPTGSCLVIDAGANLDAKPLHLYHYGVMGSLFVRRVRGEERPTVGLLSIGSESVKGNDLVKKTRALFESSDLAFIGNVEGHDVFLGRSSVVVCEGFVGNVLLKVSEGLASATVAFLREILAAEMAGRGIPPEAAAAVVERFERRTDYSEFGGAPLLGVRQTCFVCHGKSRARAIENAIREAARMSREGVIGAIQGELSGRVLWKRSGAS